MKHKLTVVILTKNEEKRIKKCLDSVSFADEIIVIDDESTDKTVEIVRALNASVFIHKKKDFSDQRNFGLSKANGKWILYLDADEEVSAPLAKEIKAIINEQTDISAFQIPRKNNYLGKPWPHIEYLERLFKKDMMKGWFGKVHESPRVSGKIEKLNNAIIHRTHRNLSEMVEKTLEWSQIEAKLRFDAKHPKVAWWRFPRLLIATFLDFYIYQGGWKVGIVGLIESMYQSFSIFITYARLWEMQNNSL